MLKHALTGLLLLAAVAAQAQTQVATVDAKARAKAVRHSAKAPVHPAPVVEELAPATLSPEQMAVAKKVLVGKIPCELSVNVTMTPDARTAGRFVLEAGNKRYTLDPVVTSTGAIRLEDVSSGAVWIQLANKSMLMNQKLGQRIADECMNPQQAQVAQALLKTPAPHLLDAPRDALVPAGPGKVAQELVPNTIK